LRLTLASRFSAVLVYAYVSLKGGGKKERKKNRVDPVFVSSADDVARITVGPTKKHRGSEVHSHESRMRHYRRAAALRNAHARDAGNSNARANSVARVRRAIFRDSSPSSLFLSALSADVCTPHSAISRCFDALPSAIDVRRAIYDRRTFLR